MRQGQLDMFGAEEPRDRNEVFDSPSAEKTKRPRKPREAKKAPMIMDSYEHQGTGNREQGSGNREQGSGNREQKRPRDPSTPLLDNSKAPLRADEGRGTRDERSEGRRTEDRGRTTDDRRQMTDKKTPLILSQSKDGLRTPNSELPTPNSELAAAAPHVYSVTELTRRVKSIIEEGFPDVWISGEITDLKNKNGRHLYFGLKDESSKLRAVIFNAESRKIPFDLNDGLEVVCHGSLDVYAPQGSYSIIIDYIEPKGIGALQLAFEQLKKKLEAEGLFAAARKRPIPYLPKRIGVVTSPTGAAVRDIVHVLTRRFPNIEILLYPVRVQGAGSAEEIANAIGELNLLKGIDVLIVGRGGGSIEDLWAFNEESVARAIAASKIPVISAVGHEIDFTIADFVADVRAATPSAAAEIAVPVRSELLLGLTDRRRKLALALRQIIVNREGEVKRLAGRITDPRKRLPDFIQRVDGIRERLVFSMRVGMEKRAQILSNFAANLSHLSPLGILSKGYAVAQSQDGRTIKSSKTLKAGDELNLRFHEGRASAKVMKVD